MRNFFILLFVFLGLINSSCWLDPENNPEDAARLFKIIDNSVKTHTLLSDKAKVAYSIRNGALDSDYFDKATLKADKNNDGSIVYLLQLFYTPCKARPVSINERINALYGTFGNLSLLEVSKPIPDYKIDGYQGYFLEKAGIVLGEIFYLEEKTVLAVFTDENYDEKLISNAIDAGTESMLHLFNFENILNEAFEGYCHFFLQGSKTQKEYHHVNENTYLEISYDYITAYKDGDCGNDINNSFIPKDIALKAFLNHPQYSLVKRKNQTDVYSIIHSSGFKRGELVFQNGFLIWVNTVTNIIPLQIG